MFYLENGMLNKDHSIHLLTKYSPHTYLPDIINCILMMLNVSTRSNLNKSKTILWHSSVLSSHGSAQLSLFSVQLWSSAGTTFSVFRIRCPWPFLRVWKVSGKSLGNVINKVAIK